MEFKLYKIHVAESVAVLKNSVHMIINTCEVIYPRAFDGGEEVDVGGVFLCLLRTCTEQLDWRCLVPLHGVDEGQDVLLYLPSLCNIHIYILRENNYFV